MADENFTCEICEKSCASFQSKNIHVRNVHGEGKNFSCDVCNKVYALKQDLKRHINTVLGCSSPLNRNGFAQSIKILLFDIKFLHEFMHGAK